MRGRPSLSSKAQKQNRFKWSKRDQLSFMRRRLHVNHYLWQCGLRLYIRELGEVCGVEVQPLHQALHQVRALVSGEGAGGETHRQPGVTFRRPYPYEIHVATQPLKCYSFFPFSFFFFMKLQWIIDWPECSLQCRSGARWNQRLQAAAIFPCKSIVIGRKVVMSEIYAVKQRWDKKGGNVILDAVLYI